MDRVPGHDPGVPRFGRLAEAAHAPLQAGARIDIGHHAAGSTPIVAGRPSPRVMPEGTNA